jgi:hypothetical protein
MYNNLRSQLFGRQGEAKVDPLRTIVECYTLSDGRVGEMHRIQQLGIAVGIDPSRDPVTDFSAIAMIAKRDGTLHFFNTPQGPVATIATTSGRIVLSTLGLQFTNPIMAGRANTQLLSWRESASIEQVITKLAMTDILFQRAVEFTPGAILSAVNRCGQLNPRWIFESVECIEQHIPAIVQTIDRTVDCINEAGNRRNACYDQCSREAWWNQPLCYGGCLATYVGDTAWCIANGIVSIVVQAAKTIVTCVLKRGQVTGAPLPGDILVFVPDSPEGWVIDAATCNYGYSHVALFCGQNNVIDVTVDGVIERPYSEVQQRPHAIIRLGLTNQQIADLCSCASSKKGQQIDYLELLTFGTFGDPGREICTMLIMHCLDQIGFDRNAIGLGGFVSPNHIARLFGIAPGYLIMV